MNQVNSKFLSYSPQLDGLRAICILFTVFNHIEGVPHYINGKVGVYVFFPLSGFLITTILLDGAAFKSYLIKRFFRIAPLYYMAFLVTICAAYLGAMVGVGAEKIAQVEHILIPSLLFSRELVGSEAPTLFGQAWTIGIEEKFYLLFPLLVLFVQRNQIVLLIFCLFLCSFFIFVNDFDFMRPSGYAAISFGVICAILYRRYAFFFPTYFSIFSLFATYVVNTFFNGSILLVSLASTFFIVSVYAEKSIYSDILSHRILVYLGKLTYSIYLFHVLVFFVVKYLLASFGITYFLIVFLFGYLLCVISCGFIYKYVESPLIRYGKSLAQR